jgi:hypothetical protein
MENHLVYGEKGKTYSITLTLPRQDWRYADIHVVNNANLHQLNMNVDHIAELSEKLMYAVRAMNLVAQKIRNETRDEVAKEWPEMTPNNTFIDIDYDEDMTVKTLREIEHETISTFVPEWQAKHQERIMGARQIKLNQTVDILELLDFSNQAYEWERDAPPSKRSVMIGDNIRLQENKNREYKYSLVKFVQGDYPEVKNLPIQKWLMPIIDKFMDENAK